MLHFEVNNKKIFLRRGLAPSWLLPRRGGVSPPRTPPLSAPWATRTRRRSWLFLLLNWSLAGYRIMTLSRITTWPTWNLQLSKINNIMQAVYTLDSEPYLPRFKQKREQSWVGLCAIEVTICWVCPGAETDRKRLVENVILFSFYTAVLKAIPPIATRYHSVVCPSVYMSSVTLVHPAKAVGRNEMPFERTFVWSQVTLY